MIHYLQNKLALAFRTRLTRYVHDLYLNDKQTYYKLALGLGVSSSDEEPTGTPLERLDKSKSASAGEGEGGGADQFITTDVAMVRTLGPNPSPHSTPKRARCMFLYVVLRHSGSSLRERL